ncbi:MAG: isoprenylcysteine carboxylmethyltransferase family protein [Anaerolineales bacterium]|nr:isoprenylcysteine carboxylmethyltransferase family protein [Anaerolineales bacterium]
MRNWKTSGWIVVSGILIFIQYILAFFVYKLPGWPVLQGIGWGIWVLALIFGIAPIFILRLKGGPPRGKSYVETTRLVDTSLYAVVRHPQYLGIILFAASLALIAQHWLILLPGVVSAILMYLEIQAADREGIEQFGDAYREYMRRVPQINIPLGLFRMIRNRRIPADREKPSRTGS